jgi:outer membrane protein OmpA-like peptidoglycan-associated protein
VKYEGKPVTVTIDSPDKVELPPRVYRCRLVGMLFDSGKTFLLPAAMNGIRELKKHYDAHPGASMLVVGHADHRGDSEPNRKLSEERARAVVAFLKDDVGAWMTYFEGGKPGRKWGTLEDQYMLSVVAGFEGPLTGKLDDATRAALRDWPRRKLVESYMAQDQTTLPAGTTFQIHGCGEFHPEEQGDSEEAMRQNRRVEIFLFDKEIEPAPPATCPAPTGCTQHAEWVKKSVETIDFSEAPENAVEVEIGWPEEVVDRLEGAVLTLDGTGVAKQEKPLSSARREDGMAVVTFRWLDRGAEVTLKAKAGTNAVTLFTDQVVGDLGVTTRWEAELEDLLEEEREPSPSGGEPSASGKTPDDIEPVRRPT